MTGRRGGSREFAPTAPASRRSMWRPVTSTTSRASIPDGTRWGQEETLATEAGGPTFKMLRLVVGVPFKSGESYGKFLASLQRLATEGCPNLQRVSAEIPDGQEYVSLNNKAVRRPRHRAAVHFAPAFLLCKPWSSLWSKAPMGRQRGPRHRLA